MSAPAKRLRVYLPLAPSDLRTLADSGRLSGPRTLFAVDEQARRDDPTADEEDLEYAALSAAADSDLAGPRRIVAAADVPPGSVSWSPTPQLAGDLQRSWVASIHVSEAGAAADEELLWYDITELAGLVGELAEGPA